MVIREGTPRPRVETRKPPEDTRDTVIGAFNSAFVRMGAFLQKVQDKRAQQSDFTHPQLDFINGYDMVQHGVSEVMGNNSASSDQPLSPILDSYTFPIKFHIQIPKRNTWGTIERYIDSEGRSRPKVADEFDCEVQEGIPMTPVISFLAGDPSESATRELQILRRNSKNWEDAHKGEVPSQYPLGEIKRGRALFEAKIISEKPLRQTGSEMQDYRDGVHIVWNWTELVVPPAS